MGNDKCSMIDDRKGPVLDLARRVTIKGLAVEDSGCRTARRAAKGLMEQGFQPTETGEKGLILSVPCSWCLP